MGDFGKVIIVTKGWLLNFIWLLLDFVVMPTAEQSFDTAQDRELGAPYFTSSSNNFQ